MDLSKSLGANLGKVLSPVEAKEVPGLGFRVQGSGFRVQGSGFRVQGLGLRVGSSFQGGRCVVSSRSLLKRLEVHEEEVGILPGEGAVAGRG